MTKTTHLIVDFSAVFMMITGIILSWINHDVFFGFWGCVFGAVLMFLNEKFNPFNKRRQ